MKTIAVSNALWVAPQPALEDFAELKRRGVALVVNNRCDAEEPGQLSSEDERSAAEAAGLAYRHLPVTAAGLSADEVRRFRDIIQEAPGRTLAHCRSGARSFFLSVLAGALDDRTQGEALALADALGLDPAAVAARLSQRANQRAGAAS